VKLRNLTPTHLTRLMRRLTVSVGPLLARSVLKWASSWVCQARMVWDSRASSELPGTWQAWWNTSSRAPARAVAGSVAA